MRGEPKNSQLVKDCRVPGPVESRRDVEGKGCYPFISISEVSFYEGAKIEESSFGTGSPHKSPLRSVEPFRFLV